MNRPHEFVFMIVAATLLPFGAVANIASNCTITPEPPFDLTDGATPPQPGVEIFIYAANSTGQDYTFECDVTEQPASVVILPAKINAMTYNSVTGKLSVNFTHIPYIEGSNVPAPPGTTTFSIALVPAGNGLSGIPIQMKGSWMATNVPPAGVDPSGAGGWELLPPTPDSPFFGYRINGPAGSTGIFRMFIPEAMRELLEWLMNQQSQTPVTLNWEDLAVYNNNQQAAMGITPQVGGGALVDIRVSFDEGAIEVVPGTEGALLSLRHGYAGSSAGVDKRLTVGVAQPLSLTADDLTPAKNSSVKLFGWVKNCVQGAFVKLTSNRAAKAAKAKGGKPLAKYIKNGWKRVRLGNDCSYQQTYTARKRDVFMAVYKAPGRPAIKSAKLTVIPR